MLFWKLLGSLITLLALFEGMVAAFHLLNLPSDIAVIEGLFLLVLLAALGFFVFRKLWRTS